MKVNIKFVFLFLILFLLILMIVLIAFLCWQFKISDQSAGLKNQARPQGIMILIEYKDMIGLNNFVNEMRIMDWEI